MMTICNDAAGRRSPGPLPVLSTSAASSLVGGLQALGLWPAAETSQDRVSDLLEALINSAATEEERSEPVNPNETLGVPVAG